VSNLGMRNSNAMHTDFGFLHGLFEDSPKIIPSNIDMLYGINGLFLLAEWKRKDEEISNGQKILLKSLSKESNFTVILINGYSEKNNTHVDNFYQVTHNSLLYQGNSIESLKSYIQTWYRLAKRI
jgi:hypothetical protein